MAESIHIDIKGDDDDHDDGKEKVHGFNQKVKSWELNFLIVNFIVELPSAVFDQLSSVHKPQFALLSMLMSFTLLIISIIYLVYNGRRERVTWMTWPAVMIPWFYYPYKIPYKPFGKFPDIFGLVCAIFQFIFSSIAYAFLSRHADDPIKVSFWPIVFAFALLYSRLPRNRVTHVKKRLHRAEAEEFILAELAVATNNFSTGNKIGSGRLGNVYRGKLPNGQQVAIKRRNKNQHMVNMVEFIENRFQSELALSSQLPHEHFVTPIGYCQDKSLLVYDYMENGSLHDHLHNSTNTGKNSTSIINSWEVRIKIALNAATAIEYLHSHANPPLIHRDIKSSKILLDESWKARVSDLGFQLLIPQSERDFGLMETGGTIGYIDPEFYTKNAFTSKSDVYSFGVVLLELLTGKAAIFRGEDNGVPRSLVLFAVPKILHDELFQVLDPRVNPPQLREAEAVKLLAQVATHCTNLNEKQRPTMTDVVAMLMQSLSLILD